MAGRVWRAKRCFDASAGTEGQNSHKGSKICYVFFFSFSLSLFLSPSLLFSLSPFARRIIYSILVPSTATTFDERCEKTSLELIKRPFDPVAYFELI